VIEFNVPVPVRVYRSLSDVEIGSFQGGEDVLTSHNHFLSQPYLKTTQFSSYTSAVWIKKVTLL